jgi:hypothetical protein
MPVSTIPQPALSTGVAGTGPAFGAYAGSQTSLSNGTYVKVLFDTEEFDTNSNFASSRFTPTVAGYYQLSTSVTFTGIVTTEAVIALYKNGTPFKYGTDVAITSAGVWIINGTFLVYANGSTDYFEIYIYQSSSRNAASGQAATWFAGAMLRSA